MTMLHGQSMVMFSLHVTCWPCCRVKAWSSLASVLHLWLLIMSAWFNTLFSNHKMWKTKLITSKLPGLIFFNCFGKKNSYKYYDHASWTKHGYVLSSWNILTMLHGQSMVVPCFIVFHIGDFDLMSTWFKTLFNNHKIRKTKMIISMFLLRFLLFWKEKSFKEVMTVLHGQSMVVE